MEAQREAKAETAHRAEEDAKRQAVEAKRKADAKRQAELEARQKAEKVAEQQAQKSSSDTKSATEEEARDWIISKIRPKVQRYSANISGRSCTIRVTVLPGGEVQNASVKESSGDESFDRSAQAAVLKASPLPWPDDEKVAAELKTFNLTVRSK